MESKNMFNNYDSPAITIIEMENESILCQSAPVDLNPLGPWE